MRRFTLLAACAALAVPVAAEAQPRLLAAGGITTPVSDLSDRAESGYHARLGVQIGIPTLPVSLRLDGSYHSLSEAAATVDPTKILGGALSVVFALPGVGLTPYLLGGVDRFRVEAGPAGLSDTTFGNGSHGGFGVNLGALALGGFAEIRYVRINRPSGQDLSYVPLTVGFRF